MTLPVGAGRQGRSQSEDPGSPVPFGGLDPELLRQFGITRLGDVTGLDTLGIPVWFATRPNSRGLSVAQGKGMTARQAQISAAMEAIEGAVAEDVRAHIAHVGTLRQLRDERRSAVPLALLSRVCVDMFDESRERAWVEGYSYRTGTSVLAPYELVGMDFRVDFPWDRQAFDMGSQGLAAGFEFEHALQHALLELIENDACFLIDTFGASAIGSCECVFTPGVSSELDAALALVRQAGVEPIFIQLPKRFGVPVFFAAIPRPLCGASGPVTRWSAGIACRLDPYAAALAALLEAVQSRLTDISGARDDLTDHRFRGSFIERALSSRRRTKMTVAAGSVEFVEGLQGKARTEAIIAHLLASGIDDVYVFPLATEHPSVFVVRLLVPGLAVATVTESHFHLGALRQLLEQTEAAE